MIFFCLYVFVFALQLSQNVVSAAFARNWDAYEIFGNSGQAALNAVFLAMVLFALFKLCDFLLRFVLPTQGPTIALSAVLFLPPFYLFFLSTKPVVGLINMNYRGCAIRIDGRLKECGFHSALANLGAALFVAGFMFAIFMVSGARKN